MVAKMADRPIVFAMANPDPEIRPEVVAETMKDKPYVMATGRSDYELVGGHESVGGEIVEDMALARRYAEHDRAVTVLTGGTELRFRMYPSGFRTLVEGWTKNFATGAGNTQGTAPQSCSAK